MRRFAVHGDLGRTILVNTHTGVKERNPAILFLFRSELDMLVNGLNFVEQTKQAPVVVVY